MEHAGKRRKIKMDDVGPMIDNPYYDDSLAPVIDWGDDDMEWDDGDELWQF